MEGRTAELKAGRPRHHLQDVNQRKLFTRQFGKHRCGFFILQKPANRRVRHRVRAKTEDKGAKCLRRGIFIRRWFLDKIEGKPTPYSFNSDEQEHILKRLVDSEGLEKFLASKYPGAKRFGLEGGESLVPLLDTLIEDFGSRGVKELVLGMSHRGRLNVLINVMGKKPSELFTEFAEDFEEDDTKTGDVKYHLGFSSNILTSGGEVHLALGSNPSHLEIVNPVILGSVKARHDRRLDSAQDMVVPILMHGDASFSAQGVVMEILQLSQTRAYGVGGPVHIVVNNQIGCTTSLKEDARSTEYCTDVAKMIDAPIIHVNGDDP